MQDKKPSWLLITGIALLPIVFVWFTLKDRYSKKVRYFSFGWLILAFIIGFAGSEKSNDTNNLTTLKHDGYQYDGYELVGNTLVLKFSGIITPQYLNKSLTQRGLKYVALLDEIHEPAGCRREACINFFVQCHGGILRRGRDRNRDKRSHSK